MKYRVLTQAQDGSWFMGGEVVELEDKDGRIEIDVHTFWSKNGDGLFSRDDDQQMLVPLDPRSFDQVQPGLKEKLFTQIRISLEDYQGQTSERITKKLVHDSVVHFAANYKVKLPPVLRKSLEAELYGFFNG